MTPRRKDLLAALSQVQNHEVFQNIDILTITGCDMTDDEVATHLEHHLDRVARWSEIPQRRRR
jgi:hypothetical protein